MRRSICQDLGFSKEDRSENIRRIGEMVKLFLEAGVIPLTAFISPFKEDRQRVRELIPSGEFIEIYCKCPVIVCEERDVKGLYKKARTGEIQDFTGISSPYEEPEHPELVLNTGGYSIKECVEQVLFYLSSLNIILAKGATIESYSNDSDSFITLINTV